MKNFLIILSFAFLAGCKLPQGNENINPSKTYKLQLNPASGAIYKYEVSNEISSLLEIDGKEVEIENNSESQLNYHFTRDSSNNLLLQVSYDKIHLYSKSGDNVTDITADATTRGISPTEKIVNFIREADIRATMSEKGEVLDLQGYQEIGDKIAAAMDPNDKIGQNVARNQWDATFGDALVKKNLDQLFKIFPDSLVAIDDEWKLTSRQAGDFPVTVTGIYKLKAINDKIALISSTGKISSQGQQATLQGYGQVNANLSGEQESTFEMEKETGMLMSCKIKATIEGTIQVMGREIPIKINSLVKVKGKRL